MCRHAKPVFSNQFGWYLSFNCVITEKCVYFDNNPYTPDNQFPRPIINQDGGLIWILSDSNVSFDGQSSFFPGFVKYGSIVAKDWYLFPLFFL